MPEARHSAPAPLLAELAQPSDAYRRRVWLAAASLSLFLILYLLLAGWFLLTAYQLTVGAADTENGSGWFVGLAALFLAVFMLKGVFFVRRGGSANHIEITRDQQPRLFAFLDDLADRAQAPRPHKVFLSPFVNAAVFYDVSPLNLIVPSKKNIEIGLALVNVLSLGEFRAVLAHEFGHVTQRSMVVGQWASIAEQVAAGLVLRLQRALQREMEFHADLVAVSLTGSDAIVHALLRLQAADDSWSRTVSFLLRRKAEKHVVLDGFTLH